jgi:hypothetical protein
MLAERVLGKFANIPNKSGILNSPRAAQLASPPCSARAYRTARARFSLFDCDADHSAMVKIGVK